MLARALATFIQEELGVPVVFYDMSGRTVLFKWMGDTERLIAAVFTAAGQHEAAIIFFGEIDGIAPVRTLYHLDYPFYDPSCLVSKAQPIAANGSQVSTTSHQLAVCLISFDTAITQLVALALLQMQALEHHAQINCCKVGCLVPMADVPAHLLPKVAFVLQCLNTTLQPACLVIKLEVILQLMGLDESGGTARRSCNN